ncbi:unnamed protein product [Rhizophagus irregularis]|nr:unnamed protein product [Rhizophagus irregularis]
MAVLCTCIWCLQEISGLGKLVSKSTRARHVTKQKKTWINSENIPASQRCLATSISQTIPMTLSPNNNILEDQDYSNEENNMNDQQIEIVDNEDEDEEYNNNGEGNENIECEDFGLKLLQIKDKHNISEAAFNEILKVFEIPGITLYKL